MESGYKLDKIILLESNFSRINKVIFEHDELINNIDIQIECTIDGNRLQVIDTMTFKSTIHNEVQVVATIKFVGLFDKVGEPILSPEEFGKINGAAILFPFIREHMSSLGSKAGLGLVVIPMANFVELAKKSDEISAEKSNKK